jgi:ribonuclease Z
MEKIEIVFLGTGSAVPTVTRNHSGIFFKYGGRGFLIDCGEGIQRQMRIAKISPGEISDIFITHSHGDHIFGLPGLFHTLSQNNYLGVLNIYGPKGICEKINLLEKISPHFKKIKMNVREVSGKFLKIPGLEVSALSLKHDVLTVGYMFEEKDKFRIDKAKLSKIKIKDVSKLKTLTEGKDVLVDGKKLKFKNLTYLEKGRKISFIFDSCLCANVKKLARDSDLAIIEGTFLGNSKNGLEMAKKYKHMAVEQAAEVAKSENVKRLIITHISQRYEYREKLLLNAVRQIFANAEIAKDFMKVEI